MANDSKTEERNRRKGFIFSVVFHTLLILLLAIFGLSWQSPPPEPGGILVNLGVPDVGQGDENAPEGEPAPPVEETKPEPVKETPPPPVEEKEPEPVKETKPEPTPQKEVKKTEDPNAAAIRKAKEEERKRKTEADRIKKEEERKRKAAEEEAERKQKEAEAAAAAKKAEEDRKRQELESLVSGGLGGGKGKGKGETGTPGNQGDPGGDPNAGALTGISTGSGTVGGGLSGRGYKRPSPPKDNSQATGVVVVYVCVDKGGNVISAEYTQSGSTTTNSNLKSIAISNAKKYKFNSGSVDKQCGTIRYDFKVK